MFIIGITGGIGAGKSTVADLMASYGIPVLDADRISHEVTRAGGSAIGEIIESFGSEYIGEDKALDRKKMGDLVFQDKKRLDQLSFIVHRHVMGEIASRVEAYKKKKAKVLVLDVPVPVKEGFLDTCDQIWLVWADTDIRLDRLEKRGMTREEAKRRIDIQMTREEYERLADHAILNNGDREALEKELLSLMEQELLSRGIAYSKVEDAE